MVGKTGQWFIKVGYSVLNGSQNIIQEVFHMHDGDNTQYSAKQDGQVFTCCECGKEFAFKDNAMYEIK